MERAVPHPGVGDELARALPATAAWRRVLCVARNTFREAVRDRILYSLVLFVLLLVVAAIFLGAVSNSQDAKIIVDLGLSAMLLFGAFIAILVGVGLVYKEIERRTVFAMLAKPIGRSEFVLGKYLGLCLMLAVNVAIMGAGVSLALLYARGAASRLPIQIWPAITLIYLELAIVTAVALLFSSFSTPVLSALVSVAVVVIGHFSVDLKAFTTAGPAPARLLFGALYHLLPNFSTFAFITPAAHGIVPPPGHLLLAGLYAVVYVTVLLAGAALIFARRDFK